MKTSRKVAFASFQTSFSRLYQVVLLLKIRESWLELKREDCARVQTEMVEFIALPFAFSRKLNIWSWDVAVVQEQKAICQKAWCSLNLLLFLRSRCRGLRSFVKSLMWAHYGGKTRAAMSFLPLYRHPYSSTLIAIRDLQVFGWILTYRALKFGDILWATVW